MVDVKMLIKYHIQLVIGVSTHQIVCIHHPSTSSGTAFSTGRTIGSLQYFNNCAVAELVEA